MIVIKDVEFTGNSLRVRSVVNETMYTYINSATKKLQNPEEQPCLIYHCMASYCKQLGIFIHTMKSFVRVPVENRVVFSRKY